MVSPAHLLGCSGCCLRWGEAVPAAAGCRQNEVTQPPAASHPCLSLQGAHSCSTLQVLSPRALGCTLPLQGSSNPAQIPYKPPRCTTTRAVLGGSWGGEAGSVLPVYLPHFSPVTPVWQELHDLFHWQPPSQPTSFACQEFCVFFSKVSKIQFQIFKKKIQNFQFFFKKFCVFFIFFKNTQFSFRISVKQSPLLQKGSLQASPHQFCSWVSERSDCQQKDLTLQA